MQMQMNYKARARRTRMQKQKSRLSKARSVGTMSRSGMSRSYASAPNRSNTSWTKCKSSKTRFAIEVIGYACRGPTTAILTYQSDPRENAVLVSVKDPLNILPSEFDVMKESWNQSVIQIKQFPEGPQADSNRDHLAVASTASSAEVDMVSGSLATGSSWPYLLGSISLLEHALSQYAMSIVVRKGFTAVSPPDVVRADLADRCGFRPRDEKAKQTYFLEGAKSEGAQDVHQQKQQSSADLCLAATAEIPLAGLLASRTFESPRRPGKFFGDDSSLIQQSELPIKLAALGHAFRAEAGARGADTRGLYRVHQFSKIEMFVATAGGLEQSNAMLEELRSTQEEIIGGLGLPYRVLDMPTEELGASAYRKYDIEVWMPGRGSWEKCRRHPTVPRIRHCDWGSSSNAAVRMAEALPLRTTMPLIRVILPCTRSTQQPQPFLDSSLLSWKTTAWRRASLFFPTRSSRSGGRRSGSQRHLAAHRQTQSGLTIAPTEGLDASPHNRQEERHRCAYDGRFIPHLA